MGLLTSGMKGGHRICLRMLRLHLARSVDFVPIVVPGRSRTTHLTSSTENSAESIKELAPDKRETTLASRNRLQDLPECLKKFTDSLVEPKSTSSGSDSRDPQVPPHSDPPSTRQSIEGKAHDVSACSQRCNL